MQHEVRRLDLLLAAAKGTRPGVDSSAQHGDLLVAEMAQQPPEPGGTPCRAVVVGDDEDTLADAGLPGGGREIVRVRQRMPSPPLDGQIGQLVDPDERRSRNVLFQIGLPPGLDAIERVGAVDELIADQ
jgi:hypothetical protein